MGYDSSCYELAKAFIEDVVGKVDVNDTYVKELAQEIQDTIENYIDALKVPPSPGGPDN